MLTQDTVQLNQLLTSKKLICSHVLAAYNTKELISKSFYENNKPYVKFYVSIKGKPQAYLGTSLYAATKIYNSL